MPSKSVSKEPFPKEKTSKEVVQIVAVPLTASAFAPFGEVLEAPFDQTIQPNDVAPTTINQGTADKYSDLARFDVDQQGGRTGLHLYRAQPRVLPLEVRLLERHPLGSQAFLPRAPQRFLVVVCPGEEPAPDKIKAFVTNGAQGVNYRRGVWHHPLAALDHIGDFWIIDRLGDGVNYEERWFEQPPLVTEPL